eukprot:976081-Pyramimonas_sp.AAC.1
MTSWAVPAQAFGVLSELLGAEEHRQVGARHVHVRVRDVAEGVHAEFQCRISRRQLRQLQPGGALRRVHVALVPRQQLGAVLVQRHRQPVQPDLRIPTRDNGQIRGWRRRIHRYGG